MSTLIAAQSSSFEMSQSGLPDVKVRVALDEELPAGGRLSGQSSQGATGTALEAMSAVAKGVASERWQLHNDRLRARPPARSSDRFISALPRRLNRGVKSPCGLRRV